MDNDHPFLTAQTWIDKALQRIENGEALAVRHVFTDLRALACWVLRLARPGDFTAYGEDIDTSCQAYLSERLHRNSQPGVFAPTNAAVTAAALTDAVAIRWAIRFPPATPAA